MGTSAKVRKVLGCLTKLGGEQEPFDISIALKIDEDVVQKALEELSKEGLASCRTDDAGKAFWKAVAAKKSAAPAKSPAKESASGAELEEFGPGPGLPGKPALAAAICALCFIAVIAAVAVAGGSGKKAIAAADEARAAMSSEVQALKSDFEGKIAKLGEENKTLAARVDSLGKALSASAAKPAAAPPAARQSGRRR